MVSGRIAEIMIFMQSTIETKELSSGGSRPITERLFRARTVGNNR